MIGVARIQVASACCFLTVPVVCVNSCSVMLASGEMAEHSLDVHKEECKPILSSSLSAAHKHGPNCGHDKILHGDHFDDLVRQQALSQALSVLPQSNVG